MKSNFLFLLFILSVNAFPHFKYDGIESSHECSSEEINIFTIYGTLTSEITPEMTVEDYFIDDMGLFKCVLLPNEVSDKARKHKIECSLKGTFERKGYIIEEPKVHGFDFLFRDGGRSTWPKKAERKTYLMSECGQKIDLSEPTLLVSSSAFIDVWSEIRQSTVDAKLSSLPSRSSTTIDKMSSSMSSVATSNAFNQAETAYFLFKWISENIAYDCYGLNHGTVDYSMEGTYSKGKGVCAGYAQMYKYIANKIGLESEYVVGYSKGASYRTGSIPTRTDHAWNVVKIDGVWYLLDSTWGSGTCSGDTYNKAFSPFYFCTPPDRFVKSHLPAESQWQLLDTIIDLTTFVSQPDLAAGFYNAGFTEVYPNEAVINANKEQVIKLYHDGKKKDILVTGSLYHLEGNTYYGQEKTLMVTKSTGLFNVNLYLNKVGEYKVQLYSGDSSMDSYPFICDFIIKTTVTATTPLYFPTFYNLYSKSDIQLSSPVNSPLVQGKKITFKLTTTTYDNIYVAVGSSGYFTELYKNGNEFSDTDIYIFGDKVAICTKVTSGSYSYILLYDTIKDPNSSEVATFPQAYSSPKNKLISPLRDTLKKGTKYTFSIQCDSVSSVAIIDNGSWTYLTKSGTTFTGSTTIASAVGGSVKLSYKEGNSNSYYSFYAWKVVS